MGFQAELLGLLRGGCWFRLPTPHNVFRLSSQVSWVWVPAFILLKAGGPSLGRLFDVCGSPLCLHKMETLVPTCRGLVRRKRSGACKAPALHSQPSANSPSTPGAGPYVWETWLHALGASSCSDPDTCLTSAKSESCYSVYPYTKETKTPIPSVSNWQSNVVERWRDTLISLFVSFYKGAWLPEEIILSQRQVAVFITAGQCNFVKHFGFCYEWKWQVEGTLTCQTLMTSPKAL